MQSVAVFSPSWLTNVTQDPNDRELTFNPEFPRFLYSILFLKMYQIITEFIKIDFSLVNLR
jgi:hypothetical protein